MEQKTQKTVPYYKVRVGCVSATIWENTTPEGHKRYSVAVTKNYKAGEEWKTTNSYNIQDLAKIKLAVDKAYEHLFITDNTEEAL